jgi:hypothetical protein
MLFSALIVQFRWPLLRDLQTFVLVLIKQPGTLKCIADRVVLKINQRLKILRHGPFRISILLSTQPVMFAIYVSMQWLPWSVCSMPRSFCCRPFEPRLCRGFVTFFLFLPATALLALLVPSPQLTSSCYTVHSRREINYSLFNFLFWVGQSKDWRQIPLWPSRHVFSFSQDTLLKKIWLFIGKLI